ncbi:MAG: hypothetical protein WC784_03575 [Candidatus Shapirobacteria bacterium]
MENIVKIIPEKMLKGISIHCRPVLGGKKIEKVDIIRDESGIVTNLVCEQRDSKGMCLLRRKTMNNGYEKVLNYPCRIIKPKVVSK